MEGNVPWKCIGAIIRALLWRDRLQMTSSTNKLASSGVINYFAEDFSVLGGPLWLSLSPLIHMPKCVYKMYEEVIFPFIRVCMGNREPFLYSPSHVILSHNVLPNHCCCLISSSLNCLTQASCSLCWKLCNMALMHSKSYKSEVSKVDHHSYVIIILLIPITRVLVIIIFAKDGGCSF